MIGRDAFEMSVSLRQNFWKPPPVPDEPTVTRVPAFAFWNSSATASVIGNTVLDPSAVITRASLELAVAAGFEPSPPQAIKLAEQR